MSDGDLILIPEAPGVGRLGRHVEHDPRSKQYRAVEHATPIPTVNKVWKRAGVFDQGNLGSCTGNAVVGIAASEPFRLPKRHYGEAQAVKVYKRATVLDGFDGTYPPDDTGSSGLAACKAAVEYGFAKGYKWGFGVEDLAVMIVNDGACAAGTDWKTGMDTPDADGLVHNTGSMRGGHEYEIIGWHYDQALGAPAPRVFECVQSWGPTWGVPGTHCVGCGHPSGGRFFVSYDDMGELLAAGGDCVTLVR